jgi:hypothetical protein
MLEHCEAVRFFKIIRTPESLSNLPWTDIEKQFSKITDNILHEGSAGRGWPGVLAAKPE